MQLIKMVITSLLCVDVVLGLLTANMSLTGDSPVAVPADRVPTVLRMQPEAAEAESRGYEAPQRSSVGINCGYKLVTQLAKLICNFHVTTVYPWFMVHGSILKWLNQLIAGGYHLVPAWGCTSTYKHPSQSKES